MIKELIIVGASFFHPQPHMDSVGVETINGKVFVVHKVDEKETLYSIARRYGASVNAIVESNPGIKTTLEVGQIVKVPYTRKASGNTNTTGASSTHKVAAGETMYSIARTYNISVDGLKKWNSLSGNSISVGQELVVKKGGAVVKTTTNPDEPKVATETKRSTTGTHTVATKETLFSIARQYGVSVSDIRNWNDLDSDELKIGQTLYVANPDKSQVAITKNTEAKPANEQKPITQNSETKATTEQKVVTQNTEVKPVVTDNQPVTKDVQTRTENSTANSNTSATKTNTIKISESMKNSDEVLENGLAELIEGTEGNRKYLALHRTAPVGTILKVRNEMNNREVFVRVIGKLPETALTDKVILRISRSAYDRLGAIDPRFRVELTYYK